MSVVRGAELKKQWQQCCVYLCKYPVAILVSITVLLAGTIAIVDFHPINLYYSITFEQAPAANSNATFTFDTNKDYASSSRQTAKIANSQATIHLDPLNEDSKTLTITVKGNNATASSFVAHINVRGQFDFVVKSIPSSELKKKMKMVIRLSFFLHTNSTMS